MFSQTPAWLVFAKSFFNKPREAGTPFSCSKAVAERMVSHIPEPNDEVAHLYLEIGPGTGIVTERLVKKLGKKDTLHIVEIEENFYNYIKEKYKDDKRVIVHHADISAWSLKEGGKEVQFDAIATGVPLNGLPNKEVIKKILAAYERLAKKGAEITSVEYVLTGCIGEIFKGQEFRQVVKTKDDFFKHHKSQSEIVWWNFPVPARVHRFSITDRLFKE